MKNLFHSVSEIQNLLHGEGIYTIVIGGLAVAAWGEPRVTRDIDLKIHLGRNNSEHLLTILGSNYHTLVSNPAEMLRTRGLIFLHDKTGTRFDLLLADTPYDEIAIQRGMNVEVQPGSIIRMCTAEDLIIYKMISTRLRDHEDIKGVIYRQGELLDQNYIIGWLQQFEIALDDSTLVHEFKHMVDEYHR
jgi:hypothetical protein